MTVLQIDGDPTTWALGDGVPADAIQQALTDQAGAIVVPVLAPLAGQLVLSTQAATVAILRPPIGWIPGGAIEARGVLYVPSPAGPTAANPGYTLQESVDYAALEAGLAAAMTDGTTIAVQVTQGIYGGPLLLNGSTLPFAIICRTGG
jgi:hypothetical protein